MNLIVYGIKNCNTVKAAVDWLKRNNVEFEFHDFKSRGITAGKLTEWCAQSGWESLVNKRGTTWRQLPADVQAKVTNQSSAIALMQDRSSVIKRPVIESSGKIVVLGFDEARYQETFL